MIPRASGRTIQMKKRYPFSSWIYRNILVYPPEELDNQVECGLSIPMTPPFESRNPEHVEQLKKYLERAEKLNVRLILFADFTVP